ncbi:MULTISPECIES: ferrochelatase [unclassified Moraxella]|uniref:ferrochelatase n=1 Tax=unclassified Moraxella TaxID=2685852 RepID=UPI003AF85A5D
MKPITTPKIALILINLGTPDTPTVPAVRTYLKQFLSDTRVIEIPKLVWQIILNLFVLTTRPKRVAHAYASVWDGDSPLRKITFQQAELLEQRLTQHKFPCDVSVHVGMTYGKPALSDMLTQLTADKVEHIVMLPLYPQYSATTTGAVFDVLARWGMGQRNLPSVSFIKDYFAHPLYIGALADSIRRFQATHGKPQKLLFSFHGIPKPYEDKGDPYARRCRCTAGQVAQALGLKREEWECSFQSRFGKQEWVKPYTSQTLEEWGKQGVGSVQVVSPSFSADCLETLEELAVENRDVFLQAGGKSYDYIPALNSDEGHIDLLETLALPHLKAWQDNLLGYY